MINLYHFGKRECMSLTGGSTNQSTQSRIVYISTDGNYILYIDLIYLDKDIGNDMVYSDVPSKTTLKNEIVQKFRQDILSYNNSLIRITMYSNKDKPVNNELQYPIDKAVTGFFTKL